MNRACNPPAMRACRGAMAATMPLLLVACTASQRSPDAVATEVPVAQAAHPAPAPARWRVVGTEPFWSVRVDGASLLFATPESPDGRVLDARVQRQGDAVEFHGEDGGKPFTLRLAGGACSDGMSDRHYAFNATFEIDGTRYTGCANEGLDSAPAPGAD